MNLTSTTDEVMMFCIVASMAIFDAFSTLLSILKKGIFVDQKSLLMQKTNKELKAMLTGVKRISSPIPFVLTARGTSSFTVPTTTEELFSVR